MRATCLLMSPSWSRCLARSPPRRSCVVVLSSSLIGVCVHLCTSVSQLSVEATPAGFPVAPSDGSPAGLSVDPVSGDSTPVSGFVVSAPVSGDRGRRLVPVAGCVVCRCGQALAAAR